MVYSMLGWYTSYVVVYEVIHRHTGYMVVFEVIWSNIIDVIVAWDCDVI